MVGHNCSQIIYLGQGVVMKIRSHGFAFPTLHTRTILWPSELTGHIRVSPSLSGWNKLTPPQLTCGFSKVQFLLMQSQGNVPHSIPFYKHAKSMRLHLVVPEAKSAPTQQKDLPPSNAIALPFESLKIYLAHTLEVGYFMNFYEFPSDKVHDNQRSVNWVKLSLPEK